MDLNLGPLFQTAKPYTPGDTSAFEAGIAKGLQETGTVSTQTSGGWSGFFGGLNDLALGAVDGYTQIEIAKLTGGRTEATAPNATITDSDPGAPSGRQGGMISGITQDQIVIGGGLLVAGVLLYAALK